MSYSASWDTFRSIDPMRRQPLMLMPNVAHGLPLAECGNAVVIP
ncbi:hypothetical protein [Actinopolyspora saharensis]|nr:hypothetical protein [Actinopolyspora saharensis]